ncbi:Glycoside hydrolase superfamily [Penicillium cinerascens]|uniref:chitinase n=1 Tax=Penicillium cinerascens TaxID=70096 RepID=A0A9W9M8Z7_9EURO|nr:Glycoside hydrolase superfamily [Penicillium cinerascens]KAJ5191542.1 Glycoside hydrolase superfamily [Penicillium cinerascens]
MRRYSRYLSGSVLLASMGGVQAKLDLNSSSNIAVYWGQNSFEAAGGQGHAQQPLGYYCDNKDIDVIPMAFDMMINGPGGAPEIDFSITSAGCDVFKGTQLKNCPGIGKDIKKCQDQGKTILLSIGGATYSEGGFKSEADAKNGAQLIWETFGPKKEGSKALRPFGDASLDGFDFDFEANVEHMVPFANGLRDLMNKETDKQYFLTAAPQCPYPDQADKQILNGPVDIDAVWVQFYNNYCGVNNFNTDQKTSKFNFEEWDNWAKTVSKNKNVKVLVGVPADTTAASTGYVSVDKIAQVVEYSKQFESFGGVMMWDASQAYANQGFIDGVRKALGEEGSGSSSSSSSASTTAPAPSSTNTTNTSTSSNAPGSSSSSSSSSGSGSSSSGPDQTPTPTPTTLTTKPTTKPTTSPEPTPPQTTTPQATKAEPTTTTPAPEPTSTSVPTETPTTTTPAPAPTTPPAQPDDDDDDDDDSSDDGQSPDSLDNLFSGDLFGLLSGIRQANNAVNGVAHGLAKNLRRANRIGY